MNTIKLWYKNEHDGASRWMWIDYIKNQHSLQKNWFMFHPEAYFDI